MKILTFVYTIDQAILYLNDFLNSNIFYFKLSLFSVSFFPFTLIFFLFNLQTFFLIDLILLFYFYLKNRETHTLVLYN